MKGFVIRKSDGAQLMFGRNVPGTKIAQLAADPANEFVPNEDARAVDLRADMARPAKPTKSLADILVEKGVLSRADLA